MARTFTQALERSLQARKAARVPTPPPAPERPLYGPPVAPAEAYRLPQEVYPLDPPEATAEDFARAWQHLLRPPRPWWRRLFAPKFTEDPVRASQAMPLALQYLAGVVGQISLHLEARRGPKVDDVRDWSRRLRAAADALDKMVEPSK